MFRLALWVVTTLFFAVSAVEFTIPTSSFINGVTTGVPFNITWADAVGDVMLLLIDGTSNITVSLIQSGIADVSWYSWTPSTSLPNDSYRLEIGDITAAPAYSALFPLSNGGFSITSQQVSTSTSSTTSHHHTWSHTWSGSYTHTRSATATQSSTNQPPPPPGCSASCSRNLNDTRVTYTPDTADAAATHATTSSASAESMNKPTQHKALPNSTKAAIGVGAALGGNIIIALAILTFWRGKRAARSRKGSEDKFVMHGGLGAKVEPVEMDATAPSHTLDVDGRTHNVAQSENG